MKTEVKAEIKEELLNKNFDASEQVGIDLITSNEFDQNLKTLKSLVGQQCTSLNSDSTEKSEITNQKPDGHYRCPLCQVIFESVALRKTHIDLAHKTYKCDICKGIFESKQDCLIHIESIHSQKPTPKVLIANYKCHVCSRLYKKQLSLVCHLKKVCLIDQTEKSANLRNFRFAFNKTKKHNSNKTIRKTPSENKVGEFWDGEEEYFDLPYGWTKRVVYLRNQQSTLWTGKVRKDIYLISPGVKGKLITSDVKLQRFLEENPSVKCDQAVTSTTKKKHRELLEKLKKEKSNLRNFRFSSKKHQLQEKKSNLRISDLKEAPISNMIQIEDNNLVDKSQTYVINYKRAISKDRKKTLPEKCPICQASFANFSNSQGTITKHINKCKRIETEDNPLVDKSKTYVSNYDRNQSFWKMSGEKQEIPEWSICLDCVPHKVLKDSDESMDKHFAENPEHYQINPFHLCF